jgi:hypothetical protein
MLYDVTLIMEKSMTHRYALRFAAVLMLVGTVACVGSTSTTSPSPTPSSGIGTYDVTLVGGAPLETRFVSGCGAPDTRLWDGTGWVRSGRLELRTGGRFQLTFEFLFDCSLPGTPDPQYPILNTQGAIGAWSPPAGDPAGVELRPDPGQPNGIIYQTRTRGDGTIESDIGIGTNRGPLIKTFVFRKRVWAGPRTRSRVERRANVAVARTPINGAQVAHSLSINLALTTAMILAWIRGA